MLLRFATCFALAALTACSGSPTATPPPIDRVPLAPPAAVALAAHADADHAYLAGGLQDLDKAAERFVSALESLPEPTRTQTQGVISRAKLLEWFGFDPTKRAGWDDIGVDAAAGVFFLMDDRWPGNDAFARQVVVFVHLTHLDHWKALLTRKGAVFAKEGDVETCEIGKMTIWLTPSGQDYALTIPSLKDSAEAHAAALKTFVQVAKVPTNALDKTAGWKAALRDAGRPWMVTWARSQPLAQGVSAADAAHFGKIFPQFAWWLGDGWAFRLGTTAFSHAALHDMFVPEKAAPACAGLIPAEGWGAARLSIHLDKFADGLLRLTPPSTPVEKRMVLAAAVSTALALTGQPPPDVMAAWNGHLCGGLDMATVPTLLNGQGLPNWVLVFGVQDGAKADTMLAALADRAKNALSMPVRTVTVAGRSGYFVQAGPFGITAVRDGERVVLGPSVDALEVALARPLAQSLAGTPMGDALDGRNILGLVVDLATAREMVVSILQARETEEAEAKTLADTFSAVLGTSRLVGMTLRLEDETLAVGPAAVSEGGWSGGTMIGILAAIAIPQFHKYMTRAKTAEARQNLRQIRHAAVLFWQTEHLDRNGKPLPPRFPQTTVVTPGVSCCDAAVDQDGDQRCDAAPNPWLQVGWQELGCQPEGQHHYRYRFESAGTGDAATFVATAYGDLDCDGVQSTYQVVGKLCHGKACKDKFRFDEKETAAEE